MFCSNCGAQVGDNDKFCKACGTPVNSQSETGSAGNGSSFPVESKSVSDKDKDLRKKKGTILAIISMAILFGLSAIVIPLAETRVLDDQPVIGLITAFVYVAAVITAYVMMIVSLVKYRNVLAKVMIVIYIIILVVTLILGAVLMVSIFVDCSNDFTECVHHF